MLAHGGERRNEGRKKRLLLAAMLLLAPCGLSGQQLPDGKLAYVQVSERAATG